MKVIKNGNKVEMSYEEVCAELGFIASVHFVKVTSAGTIGYTVGKPYEINALRAAVKANGYKASKSLLK